MGRLSSLRMHNETIHAYVANKRNGFSTGCALTAYMYIGWFSHRPFHSIYVLYMYYTVHWDGGSYYGNVPIRQDAASPRAPVLCEGTNVHIYFVLANQRSCNMTMHMYDLIRELGCSV